MSFSKGDRLRIKPSESLTEFSGALVDVLDVYVGKYPSIEGATYCKVKLVEPRVRCRYCGVPRTSEREQEEFCRGLHQAGGEGPHDWRDASVLDVHEDWLVAP